MKLPNQAAWIGRAVVAQFWRASVPIRSRSWCLPACLLVTAFLGSPERVAGQDRAAGPTLSKNPLEGNAEAIRTGKAVFGLRCSECHGVDAKGGLGPDLTTVWAAGATDEGLFQTIRQGVVGTDMPRSNAPDDENWAILAYLRTVAVPTAPVSESVGDAANGERIFWASCGSCHRINGRGGALGPDLSRIGSRGRAVLVREIRTASVSVLPAFQSVTLVTSDGRRIRGVRNSEDAFSIRIMDTRERLQGFLKKDLREVSKEKVSLMPDFPVARLNDRDLDDLVRFLSTLRVNAGRP